mmetsp:Transcript_72769/g.137624  ORF Transcript_72769/g.137624 Transcript_72769/m.137624 type:complete len:324 (+) Transcript_72769:87-1058(+)
MLPQQCTCLLFVLVISSMNATRLGVECDPSKEVACDGRCVVKASIEPIELAEAKFKEFLKLETGKEMELNDITMGEWKGKTQGGVFQGRHELWLCKFFWLRARFGGACEADAFNAALDGVENGEVLQKVAEKQEKLATIAASKLPVEELDDESDGFQFESIDDSKVTVRRKKKHAGADEEHDEFNLDLKHVNTDRRKNKNKKLQPDEPSAAEGATQEFPIDAKFVTVRPKKKSKAEQDIFEKLEWEKLSNEFAAKQSKLENDQAGLEKEAAEAERLLEVNTPQLNGDPYNDRITNKYMTLRYTTSGYGQNGKQAYVEKAGKPM